MDQHGKYDREDAVRLAWAAFGPAIELDRHEGKHYYIDLLAPDGPVRMRKVARLLEAKDADALAREVLRVAEVARQGDEPMVSLTNRVRARRDWVRRQLDAKLNPQKESADATS